MHEDVASTSQTDCSAADNSQQLIGCTDANITDYILSLCYAIDKEFDKQHYERCVDRQLASRAREILHAQCGFNIVRDQFKLPKSTAAVHVVNGTAPVGAVVAIYPGTVYLPGDPAYTRTIANDFIYRCADGSIVDGCEFGMSKLVYKSCSFRSRHGAALCSDQTWLTTAPAMPLALGHHVRSTTDLSAANCQYRELDIALAMFPDKYRRYMPCVMYRLDDSVKHLRVVVLIATRTIEAGERIQAESVIEFREVHSAAGKYVCPESRRDQCSVQLKAER